MADVFDVPLNEQPAHLTEPIDVPDASDDTKPPTPTAAPPQVPPVAPTIEIPGMSLPVTPKKKPGRPRKAAPTEMPTIGELYAGLRKTFQVERFDDLRRRKRVNAQGDVVLPANYVWKYTDGLLIGVPASAFGTPTEPRMITQAEYRTGMVLDSLKAIFESRPESIADAKLYTVYRCYMIPGVIVTSL